MKLKIHPAVGVARLGNSTTDICLSPDSIGGLPYDADSSGNKTGVITDFKDASSRIKRQGQVFKIFQENGEELTLDSPTVAQFTWTVHLASKKAAWYQYSELKGNLLYGPDNSYECWGVPFRNPDLTTEQERQTLIVDPGPRTVWDRGHYISFRKEDAPDNYPTQYPPEEVKYGVAVRTLGDLKTDASGRLVVLGGFGNAGGNEPLTSYGGSSTWHDDISDGPVYCTVSFNDGTPDVSLKAWCVVGSPDFAPEIVNISNLSDTMFDVAVRNFNLVPAMCQDGVWNTDYRANFQRDILPIINRMGRYQWVANVQPMMVFASNVFDFTDNSQENWQNRQNYYNYFRQADTQPAVSPYPQEQLFKENGDDYFPMMPLNSGSNSVSNVNVMKFLALDDTQLFLLEQWANGAFESNPIFEPYPVHPLDAASVGNCVGLPMCPGIEVTWSLQNPKLYTAPYQISQYGDEAQYLANGGLTPSRDECEGGGCEPGDLTKRMACPWQADFFQCTVQYINFSNPSVNKVDGAPLPPNYYSYWWPPQSPWDVLVGEFTAEGQKATNVPGGQQMNYARGINSFTQMVEHWSALGFIRDRNSGSKGFPFLVETERNNDLFSYKDWYVSNVSNNLDDSETTIPVFFIDPNKENVKAKSLKAALFVEHLEEIAFKKIEIATGSLGLPRSGTRNRR